MLNVKHLNKTCIEVVDDEIGGVSCDADDAGDKSDRVVTTEVVRAAAVNYVKTKAGQERRGLRVQ